MTAGSEMVSAVELALMALYPDGGFAFTMGTPGGDSQTQSLLQIVNNMLLFDMTPQQAIEAPRLSSSKRSSLVATEMDPHCR